MTEAARVSVRPAWEIAGYVTSQRKRGLAEGRTELSDADSRAERYKLRAALRQVTECRRERLCGVVAAHEDGPYIDCVGRPGAWEARWKGIAMCGHIWTCPVCSERLRGKRLCRCMRALEVMGGRWQMVTVTIRHHEGMPLRKLVDGLNRAWRRARQGRAAQEVWQRRVTASIRALEVTHGENGWHPHVHVLLRTSGWSEEQRAELLLRFRRAVAGFLGHECVPDAEHAIVWSTPIDADAAGEAKRAAYIAKLGLEIVGAGKVARVDGSRSQWEVARAAAAGDERSIALWREFRVATKGRRMIELDDRAAEAARKPRDVDDDGSVPAPPAYRRVWLHSEELGALRMYERRDRAVLSRILADVALAEDPEVPARAWVEIAQRSGSRLRVARWRDTGL